MNLNHYHLGGHYLSENKAHFLVWAPRAKRVNIHLIQENRFVAMDSLEQGYFGKIIENLPQNTLYQYQLDGGQSYPDPASRYQPDGVHGPSQVINIPTNTSAWPGLDLEQFIIYELHVGTFTPEGNFDALITRLDYLKDLGITAIELMPVSQFPGTRNWGYDAVFPFAIQNTYGGPLAYQKLINACHQKGLAVIQDVIYNHLGPEGNVFNQFGFYFTEKHTTPWGNAINFDDTHHEAVRRYVCENLLYWFETFQVDALRLDAVHAIKDDSSYHIFQQMTDTLATYQHRTNRKVYLIAESDLNDVKLIKTKQENGYGFDAQWNDDFHHALHTVLTAEHIGYYADFGQLGQLAKALEQGYVYTGEYSKHRGKVHGTLCRDLPAKRFVIYAQTHDQVGNRATGDRLATLISFAQCKLAGGLYLLSPYLPQLFMGEEWGETAPFLYFIDHSDKELIANVQKGRQAEFPDAIKDLTNPQAKAAFLGSKIRWDRSSDPKQQALFGFYQILIQLRKSEAALQVLSKQGMRVVYDESSKWLYFTRSYQNETVFVMANFSDQAAMLPPDCPKDTWQCLLSSEEKRWLGQRENRLDLIIHQILPYELLVCRWVETSQPIQ